MVLFRSRLAAFGFATALFAHPMGNFSVNRYARLEPQADGLRLHYVLDLAEIPTLELLQQWNVRPTDEAALGAHTSAQARQWIKNLSLIVGQEPEPLQIHSVTPHVTDGAGGMPVLRVDVEARAALLRGGRITYQDGNYPGRAGWKEIVLVRDGDATPDLSAALTAYPVDPGIAPPQQTSVEFEWTPSGASRPQPVISAPPVTASAAAPAHTTAAPASFATQQPSPAGTVVKGDLLSRLIHRKDLAFGMILLALAAAFGLGSMHALSPGHGKTIVAAYLVGSRGTWKHAGFLGFMVTFTHTASVFLLGLGVLFFQQYIVPEQIMPLLGVASGLSIVAVGAYLLYQRAKVLMHVAAHEQHHHHHHDHDHDHEHHHHTHVHTHDGHTHSHVPEGKVTMGSLIALGISGGLVPCPSALVLMLSAIALGRTSLGLALLVAFSAGLALVLTAVGLLVVYGRNLLPGHIGAANRPAFRLIPVFSAVVVICLGLAMAATSAGWVKPLGIL